MENSSIIHLLKKVKIDEELFTKLIMPKAQEAIVELLKPECSQMRVWKNTASGRKEFEKYILSKFMEIPTKRTINILWNYYSGNKTHQRSRMMIKEFIRVLPESRECAHCGTKTGNFQVDHIVPLVKGGEDEFSNLQLLCASCNLKKSSHFDCRQIIF